MYHVNPAERRIGSRNTMSTRLPGVIEKQVEHAMFIQIQRPGRKLSDQSMTEFVDQRRVLLISCIAGSQIQRYIASARYSVLRRPQPEWCSRRRSALYLAPAPR